MDSEDSRGEAAGDASSDGEGSSASALSSPRRASISSVGSKNASHSNPQSPQSVEGPESSDKERPTSHQSTQNSDIDSPENSRPPSPECPPRNGSRGGSRSPSSRPASLRAEQLSPAPSSPSPSSPNPSNSVPVSPGSPTYESASYNKKTQKNKSNSDNKWSPKSDSRSRQNSLSPDSAPKRSPQNSPKKSQIKDESNSSRSSRDSSPRERSTYVNNPPTEEISDGEMEFDHEEKQPKEKSKDGARGSKKDKKPECNMDISHEDLSDVSDLESMGPASEDDCRPSARKSFNSGRELSKNQESARDAKSEALVNNDKKEDAVSISSMTKLTNGNTEPVKLDKIPQEKTNKTDDVEEQLDFEAEEGECLDAPLISRSKSSENNANSQNEKQKNDDDEGSGAASSLEEGEVSDDEDRRPEETEPRPVCRFYSRGQCTWGVSCRFLHPGVTDKGNYTMFDMVRTMPASGYSQHHPGHLHPHLTPAALQHHSALPTGIRVEPPQAESAWERGLRTAKEMMRKACKRKEQDTDFEEKKMHLSLGGGPGHGASLGPGEEDDPDLAAYAGLPPPSSPPIVKRERDEYIRVPERRQHYDDAGRGYNVRDRGYERVIRSSVSPPRGLASHVYDDKLEDRGVQKPRRGRTTREVIVQRAPGVVPSARADDWADPWMRGGGNRSPGTRRAREKPRRRRRGYSTGSSYSSSSSSRSSSRSSNSSARSGSAGRKKRRRPNSPGKPRRAALSPSVIVQERRAATARAVAMNPPPPSARKRIPSPATTRQNAANPPAPHSKNSSSVDEFGRTKPTKTRQRKLYSKSSSSDSSSSSSESDSDSHSSSSSDSSKGRAKVAHRGVAASTGTSVNTGGLEKKLPNKVSSGTRLLSPKYIADAQKKEATENARKDGNTPKKRPAASPIAEVLPAKKPVSRREELLKQLKAVEDAIARKRSKI